VIFVPATTVDFCGVTSIPETTLFMRHLEIFKELFVHMFMYIRGTFLPLTISGLATETTGDLRTDFYT
jgi:hypothetical protein